MTFHLFLEEPISLTPLFLALCADHGLRPIEFASWLDELANDESNTLLPLIHELRAVEAGHLIIPKFDNKFTTSVMTCSGISLGPSLEYVYFCKQLQYMRAIGVLPAATSPPGRVVAEVVFRSLKPTGRTHDRPKVFQPRLQAEVECLCMACDDSSCNFFPIKMFRRPVGEWDVCIKIVYCGVCHSDLSYGASRLPMPVHLPAVLGHEAVGVCTQVGAKVTRFRQGDHIGVGNLVDSCMRCHFCVDGEEQWCSRHVP
eukprot:4978724-Prymnesium_polylepis.1